MSKYTIYTVFDVQTNDRLQDTLYLSEFVKRTADYEFYFSADTRREKVSDLDLAVEIVTQNRNQAIENGSVSDILRFDKNSLSLSIGFDIINWNLFVITVSSGYFSHNKKERVLTIRDFVSFCEIAYNIFAPDYGYGLTSPE